MLKIKIETEEHDMKSLALEIEHTAQLINQGWTEGRGWKIEGEPEKRKAETIKEEPLESDYPQNEVEL